MIEQKYYCWMCLAGAAIAFTFFPALGIFMLICAAICGCRYLAQAAAIAHAISPTMRRAAILNKEQFRQLSNLEDNFQRRLTWAERMYYAKHIMLTIEWQADQVKKGTWVPEYGENVLPDNAFLFELRKLYS